MDRRLLVGALLGGVTVLAATGVVIVIADSRDPVFIAGDQPVTAQQVHTKLQADGYSDIRIVREGRYFEANGAKDGKPTKLRVDSQTGRLANDDDDDDD